MLDYDQSVYFVPLDHMNCLKNDRDENDLSQIVVRSKVLVVCQETDFDFFGKIEIDSVIYFVAMGIDFSIVQQIDFFLAKGMAFCFFPLMVMASYSFLSKVMASCSVPSKVMEHDFCFDHSYSFDQVLDFFHDQDFLKEVDFYPFGENDHQ